MAIKVKHDGGASSAFAAAAAGGAGKRRAQQSVEMMKSEAQQSMSDNQIAAQLATASMRGGGGGGGGGGGHAPSLLSAPSGSAPHAQLISAPTGAGGPMSTHQIAPPIRRPEQKVEHPNTKITGRDPNKRPDLQSKWNDRTGQWERAYLKGEEEADARAYAQRTYADQTAGTQLDPTVIAEQKFTQEQQRRAEDAELRKQLAGLGGSSRMPTQGEVDAALGHVLEGARRKEAALRGLPGTAAPAASRRSNVTFTGSGVPGGDDATAGQMSRLQEVLAASRDADGNIREGWGDIYKFADEQVRNIYAQGIGYRGKDGDAKAYDRPPSGDGNNRALGYFIGSTNGGAAPGGAAQRPMPFMSGGQGVGVGRTAGGREVTTYDLPQRGTGTIREQDGTIHTLTPDGAISTTRPQPQRAAPAPAPAANPAEVPAPENPAQENPAQPDGGFDVAAAEARIEELKRRGSYPDRREIRRLKSQIKEAERPQKELSKGKDAAERQLEIMRAHPSHYSASEFEKAEERLRKATEAYNAFVGG